MPAPSERKWIDANVLRSHPPPEYAVLQSFPSLSRYASYSFLGAGEFGRVFAAVHAELGRIEAVKRIEILEPKVRKMALAEAEILARLPPHPNLVTLYNAEIDDRALYLMLQFVDGLPADKLPLPLPIGQALSLCRDTAQALSLIHAHNIVHRDIKPANLFCTSTGSGVVGDFGVARSRDSTYYPGGALIAGSPAYMAPEAFTGQAVAASDLWSLGVMLYELLTGHRPFESIEELPLNQMAAALPQVRLRLPSAWRAEVPRGVDDLVAMLLAIRPEDRLPSAMSVLDHLPRYNTMVSIAGGDLLDQRVDGLVYTANERLDMGKPGSLDKQILMRGGLEIREQAAQQSSACRSLIGNVLVSGGGALFARYVLHAVAIRCDAAGQLQPVQERDLRKALWASFRKAHELRLRTLALPAMGTSSGLLSPEDAARMMVDITHTYLLEFRPPLQQVTFVLRDRAMAIAFREAATERGMMLV